MKSKIPNLIVLLIFGIIGALLSAGIFHYLEFLLGFSYVVLFSAGQAFILGGIIYAGIKLSKFDKKAVLMPLVLLFAFSSYATTYYLGYEGTKDLIVSYGVAEYDINEDMAESIVDSNYSVQEYLSEKIEKNAVWMIIELIIILLMTTRISLAAVEK